MGFELALYLRDPIKVEAVEKALLEAFRHHPIAEASDVIEALSTCLPPNLAAPLVHLFLREGVLERIKAAPFIEGYVVRFKGERGERFFSEQRTASQIAWEMEQEVQAEEPDVELVATFPSEQALGIQVQGIGSIDAAIRRLIVSAKREVWIVNPFFDIFGAATIADALLGRAGHGVPIKIIGREIVDEQRERSSSLEPILWVCDRFREAGLYEMLKVRDFSKRDVESGRLTYALHSKIVLVDGSHCYIGSANVTQASLRMNLEIGVVLHGKSVEQVQTLTEQIWEVSVPVPL